MSRTTAVQSLARRRRGWLLAAAWLGPLVSDAATPFPENVAARATATASSAATPAGGKYGPDRANDGDVNTHWASAGNQLPQWLRLEWPAAQQVDTLSVDIFGQPPLYAEWKAVEIELSDGFRRELTKDELSGDQVFIRLDAPHAITSLAFHVTDVHEVRNYVGVDEIGAHLDPDKLLGPRRSIVKAKLRDEIEVRGQATHPTVYLNADDVRRAKRNAETTEWGAAEKQSILDRAEGWLEHDEDYWLQFLPEPGACYAYAFVGCPLCEARWGTWGGARCSWDKPGKVTCPNGHELPDAAHPDGGTGWKGPDGRLHYFLGSWNAWVTEKWTRNALIPLAHAYALTGEERYADRAGFFLDALASIYAESTSGSWDYPSSPPSGRFSRPWYQVARNLVPFVEGYDLVYNSPSMQKPSLRPGLEQMRRTDLAGPTPQKRAVGTPDAHGVSWDGMTRRDNINKNLMEDGAYYCYKHTFGGKLHNGHADYMRGALAVGVLLGISEYVYNALETPSSIYAMLANNADRDGRYYETALGYAVHCRNLYLTFVEPLQNWRCERYPDGVRLFDDPRMRSFFKLPSLSVYLCGHAPNFGDAGPDDKYVLAPDKPFNMLDYEFAERLYAGCRGQAKEEFGQLVRWLADGDVAKQRKSANFRRWLLYHADPLPEPQAPRPPTPRQPPAEVKSHTSRSVGFRQGLPGELQRQVQGSWFMGQKGLALLRDGDGQNAQGALLRYGPSLNHGDLDDLGLIYYGKGWQLAHEIGYGLGSTHTQVGWGSQTASHTLVTVNEKSQHGGSGGSLHLFCRLPGLKVMEADSPLSYANQGVSQYRRTVALLGEGEDQVLIDVFRVKGGRQHDYLVGSQGQDFAVEGLDLGPEEDGSLAGMEHAWGEKQGPDADIIGHPNKPYWNPPPGTGYGFFYDMRRGKSPEPWSVDWLLGGPNSAHFRVHVLPESDDEAIVAKAPGLYPHNRNTSYLLCRRRGEDLASCFASVMEPYAAPDAASGLNAQELSRLLADSSAETKIIPGLHVLLLKGKKPGDHMTFSVPVEKAGAYRVAARILKANSYGAVRLLLDGERFGNTFVATDETIRGPELVVFGEAELAAGKHELRFEMTDGRDRYYVGLASIDLIPAHEDVPDVAPRPVVQLAERLPVKQPREFPAAAVHLHRGDLDEYFLSAEAASPDNSLSGDAPGGPLQWRGAIAYVALRGREVVKLALHGASLVRVGACALRAQAPLFTGTVGKVDYERRWIETDAKIPADGLAGEAVCFGNGRYSRNTAYRIDRIEAVPGGSRLHLGSQPMLLGQGRVHQVVSEDIVLTDIPHEYCRSVVGGTNPRFFEGKLLRTSGGAETRIKTMEFGSPMKVEVDSTRGMKDGDTLLYYDVQVGDRLTIPTSVCATRQANGKWSAISTVEATLALGAGTIRFGAKGIG